MTRKVYRTAQGKMIDLGALQLQNETVRAVGNMGVNARGDLVDNKNRPISSKNQQVARQYNKQTNVQDTSIYPQKTKKAVDIPPPPEDFDDNFDVADIKEKNVQVNTDGISAALAKARQQQNN